MSADDYMLFPAAAVRLGVALGAYGFRSITRDAVIWVLAAVLVVMNVASTLGLTIPQTVILQADQVIE
jgi:hypothetical protein